MSSDPTSAATATQSERVETPRPTPTPVTAAPAIRLRQLRGHNVRHLAPFTINPEAGLNVLIGPNASGKTSVLEAIHVLSCGRSFRSRRLAQVLHRDSARMVIGGHLHRPGQMETPLGVEFDRTRGRMRIKAGGRMVRRTSELASLFPLVTLHQESLRIFTEGPEYRRRFLDWGLFHVEPSFLSAWRRLRRALRQRNIALQRDPAGAGVWDRELVESAEHIDVLRQRHLARLLPVFQELASLLLDVDRIDVTYQRGWAAGSGLGRVLADARRADEARGYTCHGPHRADLDFACDGMPVREGLSRGQLKILVYALHLAQASAYTTVTGRRCVMLMDDLSAELDDRHINVLIRGISDLGMQVFVTTSERRLIEHLLPAAHKVFHVEQGRLSEVV